MIGSSNAIIYNNSPIGGVSQKSLLGKLSQPTEKGYRDKVRISEQLPYEFIYSTPLKGDIP